MKTETTTYRRITTTRPITLDDLVESLAVLGIDRKTVYATEQPGQPGLAAWDLIYQTIAAHWKANNFGPVTDQDITELVEDPDSPFEHVYEV